MARTYYITAPPAVAGAHLRYTAQEVRCLAAWFRLAAQPRGLRRWLHTRWLLVVSSPRVIRHVRSCTQRRHRRGHRRRQT